MKKKLASLVVIFLFIVLKTTLFRNIMIFGVVPDLALVVIVFTAIYSDMMTGQLVGFFSGLLEDFLSLSPPGFNAFIKTLVGAIAGNLEGKMIIDPFLLPVLLTSVAVFVKYLISFILAIFFISEMQMISFFNIKLLVEILYTSLLSPIIFSIMRHLYSVLDEKKVTL